MTKDTKQTLIGLGVLAALGFYLMHKKRRILEGSEESGFLNSNGKKLIPVGEYLDKTDHLKQRPTGGPTQSPFIGNRYNTKRGFQNATGCSSAQLAEAMTHCESMAQTGETTTIKKCKIRNNGNRHVTCQYTNANGGIRYINTDVGNRKMERRTR